jgi:RHS repeat-associated protein
VTRTYAADGQGSIRNLTARDDGTVTDSYWYTAFGEEPAKVGTTENEFRYVGEELDANSGFYYNRATWMSPKSGRFVSVDPAVGDALSPVTLHRYLYAGAGPVSSVDPSGEGFLLADVTMAATLYVLITTIAVSPVYRGDVRTNVALCSRWGDLHPHSSVCLGDKCHGLWPVNPASLLWFGEKGQIQPDNKEQLYRPSDCQTVVLAPSCDKRKFEKCIDREMGTEWEYAGHWSLMLHVASFGYRGSCYYWAQDVISTCRKEVCP